MSLYPSNFEARSSSCCSIRQWTSKLRIVKVCRTKKLRKVVNSPSHLRDECPGTLFLRLRGELRDVVVLCTRIK
jgi:hypothetical protein